MKVSSSYHLYGLQAEGEGTLHIHDLDYYIGRDDLTNPLTGGFELTDGVTDVEEGFFDNIPNLTQIMIAPSVKHIGVTDKTKEIFAKNGVFVRGKFDTYAEQFAREYGICFVHANIELACTGDYFEHGNYLITLRMFPDGTAKIHQDCRCQGSSAGSVGGGECDVDLPNDFYLTHSPENIADLCWGSCYSLIVNCAALKEFLSKAKCKQGFCFR